MQAAGFTAVPYHDNVPSFGEWGWWMACKPGWRDAGPLKSTLSGINSIPVPVQYLTPELIHASLHFGKNQLVSDREEISTLMTNRVYDLYLNAWKRGL
jgi:spermidine synthase